MELTDSAPLSPARAETADTDPDLDGFDVRPYVSVAGGLAGIANVIMQLARPAVGYGVKESRVPSGNAMIHPLKRARTTFTYLSVALLGTERDRRMFRKAVNGQHAQVRSLEDSPVAYNAFDPELQLWVAACLYHGLADVLSRVREPLDDGTAERLYRYCSRLGTSLQVRPGMWPADRSAFTEYWQRALDQVSIDDTIRGYLTALVELENLPAPLRLLLRRSSRFWTTGFLPPVFRDQMNLPWGDARQARFDELLQLIGRLERLVPVPVRTLPMTSLLWDMRLRHRVGLPLV